MAACSTTCAAPAPTTIKATMTTSHTAEVGVAVPSVEECPAFRNGDAGSPNTNTVTEKTHELFQICDWEGKGLVTRRDMQRLTAEVPLNPDELENVFDTLDTDGNGYLTLDEFSSGFSEFLCSQQESSLVEERMPCAGRSEVIYQNQWEHKLAAGGDEEKEEEEEEEKHFLMLMESLGASNVFEDPSEVRCLWAQLSRDEPHLLANFEEFLARVTARIREADQEKRELESAMKRKAATHDNEIQSLYEEMELQIQKEQERILMQDSEHFLSRSQDLEGQLSSKERELDQLFQKQRRLEGQCTMLHSQQHVIQEENLQLRQTNQGLSVELEHTNQELTLAQEQLGLLQEQAARLHDQKEMEMYRVTEGLQRERASLLKQLDLLREKNKHLRDERDVCYQQPLKSMPNPNGGQMPLLNAMKSTANRFSEEDKVVTPASKEGGPANRLHLPGGLALCPRGCLQRIISIEEDHLPHLLQAPPPLQGWSEVWSEGEEATGEEQEENADSQGAGAGATAISPRGQPVGKEANFMEEASVLPPDRLFKIILVGNSSVGKTSFLKRFCDDSFYPGTSATVGVDYSVKTILVDNSQVALQVWDTAGQERYRSITKQFFRRADAVVVMYDITSEASYSGVRQWLTSVHDGASEEIPIMLLGNKTDKESEREVQDTVGERLAKDSGLLFFECSARLGHGVGECMVHLARKLKEQEDRAKEKTIILAHSPMQKKRACC